MKIPDQREQLVLASQSPQRAQLLAQLGYQHVCFPVDIDETPATGESPGDLVKRLAGQKAQRCRQLQPVVNPANAVGVESVCSGKSFDILECVVLGADTVIEVDGQVIGKPLDRNDCLQTLRKLAGRTHKVHSGICVLPAHSDDCLVEIQTSLVTMGPISPEAAAAYWNSGEPAGKAGSYAIQGQGAVFVSHISGSYSGVKGLPLYETAQLLARAGLPARHIQKRHD